MPLFTGLVALGHLSQPGSQLHCLFSHEPELCECLGGAITTQFGVPWPVAVYSCLPCPCQSGLIQRVLWAPMHKSVSSLLGGELRWLIWSRGCCLVLLCLEVKPFVTKAALLTRICFVSGKF